MAQPPVCDFGWKAPSFTLPATDGTTYSLARLKGRCGTLVMFICNHCPYVQAVIDRIVRVMTRRIFAAADAGEREISILKKAALGVFGEWSTSA